MACATALCHKQITQGIERGDYDTVNVNGDLVTTDGRTITTYTSMAKIRAMSEPAPRKKESGCHGFWGCVGHQVSKGIKTLDRIVQSREFSWFVVGLGALAMVGCVACGVAAFALTSISAGNNLGHGNFVGAAFDVAGLATFGIAKGLKVVPKPSGNALEIGTLTATNPIGLGASRAYAEGFTDKLPDVMRSAEASWRREIATDSRLMMEGELAELGDVGLTVIVGAEDLIQNGF